MTFGAAIIQLLSAAIAGVLGGWFVLLGVNAQFRRQGEAALKALKVEVDSNLEAATDIVGNKRDVFEVGKPDPGWLKHGIWDSQLPYVAQILDQPTLLLVSRAYGTLSTVPAMEGSAAQRGTSDVRYFRGGWIEISLNEIHVAFSDASQALENFRVKAEATSYRRWLIDVFNRAKFWSHGH